MNESPDQILNSYSLAEAIIEFFNEDSQYDNDYLLLRINLLRSVFGLESGSDNENARIFDELLFGYGQLPTLRILPFDGALEIPSSIDSDAHMTIGKQFKNEIDLIKENFRKVQASYITHLVIHSIDIKNRNNTVRLAELINNGLPVTPVIDTE
jgi:hypothetical protein